MFIPADDGAVLVGRLYEATIRPAPGVLLVHMLGRTKADWTLLAERLQNAGVTALAIDLRGHGDSTGDASQLSAMAGDVVRALEWLSSASGVLPDAVAVAGASLGANLAAIAAASRRSRTPVALISPSLDYRGVRLDAPVMTRLAASPLWLAASTEDPYAMRTARELAEGHTACEKRLSTVRAHGTLLLQQDPELARALVDWLGRALIF